MRAIIECDLELSLGFQGKTESCDDSMAVSKAQVDMINAHRGHAGYHPGHLKYTFDRITVEKGLTIAGVLKLPPDDQDDLKNEIEAVVSEEYLTVLFIKQADDIR